MSYKIIIGVLCTFIVILNPIPNGSIEHGTVSNPSNTVSTPPEALEPVLNPEPSISLSDLRNIAVLNTSNTSFNLKLSFVRNEQHDVFDYIHDINFINASGYVWDSATLVLWADVPLYDLTFIPITTELLDNGRRRIFFPGSPHGSINVLLPGQAFVISPSLGATPRSAISFVVNGEKYYFYIIDDRTGHSYLVDEFEDGSRQFVRVWSGGRHYFTVTLDGIGDMDPVEWFRSHSYHVHLLHLVEFEPFRG